MLSFVLTLARTGLRPNTGFGGGGGHQVSGAPDEMNLSTKARFWLKVDRLGADVCWPWLGAKMCKKPYQHGKFRIGKRLVGAHRASWELHHGLIGAGLHVLHRCDNGLCVNPSHLFLGTHQDNMKDRDLKGRQARGRQVATCRLDEVAVDAIRRSGLSQRKLAQLFGVTQQNICLILQRKTWKDVEAGV